MDNKEKNTEIKQITSPKENRKGWFKALKKFIIFTKRYKKPEFIFLGEKFSHGGIILSNHVGTDGPMSLELYADVPLRMWGAHEMNAGVIKTYVYQSKVYFHQKKHWNIHLARLFCIIASPITSMFYRGLNLISTYRDARFVKTIRESIEAIKQGENVVIFPEVSDKGYLKELEGFHAGFVMFADTCLKRGIDVPIFVTYFDKENLRYVVDKPILYSTIRKDDMTRCDVAKILLDRCNELGKMSYENNFTEKEIKEKEVVNK